MTDGTALSVVTTLPAGYWPTQTVLFSTSTGSAAFAAISIRSAGVITQTAGTGTNLHLSCTFSTL